MPKGPLGGPRPVTKYLVEIDFDEPSVDVKIVGPFGVERPLAKKNPPISKGRVYECTISEAGRSFGAGVVSRGAAEFDELNAKKQKQALEYAEKWCAGLLESAAMEDLSQEEVMKAYEQINEIVDDAAEQGGSVEIDPSDLSD